MKTIDDLENIKKQLSCCMDDELEPQDLNLLIDNLLENSIQGEQLRDEWKNLHLISGRALIDAKNDLTSDQINDLPLIDVSAQISRMIAEEEHIFPSERISTIESEPEIKPDLIKAEITSVPGSLGLFKILAAGSAIAASLMLVAINVINTENGQFIDKGTEVATQSSKPQQIANIASSQIIRPVSNMQQQNPITLVRNSNWPENFSVLVNSDSIPTGKLYKFNPQQNNYINYTNSPVINSKYSNLIHKVSLKDKNKNL